MNSFHPGACVASRSSGRAGYGPSSRDTKCECRRNSGVATSCRTPTIARAPRNCERPAFPASNQTNASAPTHCRRSCSQSARSTALKGITRGQLKPSSPSAPDSAHEPCGVRWRVCDKSALSSRNLSWTRKPARKCVRTTSFRNTTRDRFRLPDPPIGETERTPRPTLSGSCTEPRSDTAAAPHPALALARIT